MSRANADLTIKRIHVFFSGSGEQHKLLPTPGHTPGSMSMLVRSQGLPPLLLVGDLTYELDLLLSDQVPGIGDAAALRSSFAKVRAVKEQLPGLVLLVAHDPKAANALMQLQ